MSNVIGHATSAWQIVQRADNFMPKKERQRACNCSYLGQCRSYEVAGLVRNAAPGSAIMLQLAGQIANDSREAADASVSCTAVW